MDKYEEALQKARDKKELAARNGADITVQFLEEIFPELRESEENELTSAEIKQLTQETADELIKAFEQVQEATEGNVEYIKRVLDDIERIAINQVATRHAYNYKRFLTANFLTRWYWKRKVAESEKAMRGLAQIIKENDVQ